MNGIRSPRRARAKVILVSSPVGLLVGGSLPVISAPAVGDPDPNTLKISGSTTR